MRRARRSTAALVSLSLVGMLFVPGTAAYAQTDVETSAPEAVETVDQAEVDRTDNAASNSGGDEQGIEGTTEVTETPSTSAVPSDNQAASNEEQASDGEAGQEGVPNADAGQSDQPGATENDSEQPGQPTNPEDPADPENPTNPEDPTDPANPTDPEDPTNPVDPTDPENPTDPEDPVDPEDPTDPEEPEGDMLSDGPNLEAALTTFGVTKDGAYEATTFDELKTKLAQAGTDAQDGTYVIVHVPAGQYDLTKTLTIPSNVIMVAEDDAVFTCCNDGKSMFNVSGSLYGGTYDGASVASPGIRINPVTFAGKNGVIQKAVVKDVKGHGIYAAGRDCKKAKILDCTVTGCGRNAILVFQDACLDDVRGCVLDNNGYADMNATCSGISLVHGSIFNVVGCTITNNADKGLSFSSGPDESYLQPGSIINIVSECVISGNKENGIHLKPQCHINHFRNNVVKNNPDGIVCCSSADGFTGETFVKDVKNNTFTNNTNSQLHAYAPGAAIYVGAGNTFTGGKNAVLARDSGVIKISGSKNIIRNSKGAGLDANGGKIYVSGYNTIIKNNATCGIYIKNGAVSISGNATQIYGNKTSAAALYSKSYLTISGASTSIRSSGGTNIYVSGSSKLTVSGKSTNIQGAGQLGINANKGTVIISGTGTLIRSNTKAGIGATAGSKVTISGASTKIYSNGTQGIYAKGSTVSITGKSTQIYSNKSAGIAAYESAKVSVTGTSCSIKNNKQYGVYAASKARVTLKKVTITGNTKGKTYKTGGAIISVS